MSIEYLLGKSLCNIFVNSEKTEILFQINDGYRNDYKFLRMYHEQDCCEDVSIEDIVGDLQDLIHEEITMAECVTNRNENFKNDNDVPGTWTFYKLATKKGYVTLRWYGESNGYYSEEVDLELLTAKRTEVHT